MTAKPERVLHRGRSRPPAGETSCSSGGPPTWLRRAGRPIECSTRTFRRPAASRKTTKKKNIGPRNAQPVNSRRSRARRRSRRCSAGERRIAGTAALPERVSDVSPATLRGPAHARPSRPARGLTSSSRLLLDDLRDLFDGLLCRLLARVAVLDLGFGAVLDVGPLGEVLQPHRVLAERRKRLAQLRRRVLGVAEARSIGAGRDTCRNCRPSRRRSARRSTTSGPPTSGPGWMTSG